MNLPDDAQTIGRVLIGGIPAVVTLVGLSRGAGVVRSRLRHDIELLKELPDGTEARTKFETYLSNQVDRFTKYEIESTRNISGLVIAAIFTVLIGAGALALFTLDDWWWWILGVATVIVAAASLSIMFDDAQKVPRDDKGKRI